MEVFEELEVGGGRGGKDQELGPAGDVSGASRRIVECAFAKRRIPLDRIGGPAEHGGDAGLPGAARDGAADRAQADDAESRGTHGWKLAVRSIG
jgi:hypothetical protein